MVWGKSSDRERHRRTSAAPTAALAGKRGRWEPDGRRPSNGSDVARGSQGGPLIWVMDTGWEPDDVSIRFKGSACNKCGTTQHASSEHDAAADPEGYAVFGRYPRGWLRWVLRTRLLGDVARDEVLHVCSGTLLERWTIDVRHEARPRVQAAGDELPFRDASFRAVLMDPPYSDEHAKNLYRTKNPKPAWLLGEAARVVMPGGRIGILHVAVPFSPEGCRFVRTRQVTTGPGFRARTFTVYEREQDSLPFTPTQGAS